jgi:hypothetical protein
MVSPLTGRAMAAEAPKRERAKPTTADTLGDRLGRVEPRSNAAGDRAE